MSTDRAELTSLLEQVRSAGVELWTEGTRLRFRGPAGALTPEARDALRTRRDEVVALLRRQAAARTDEAPMAANQEGLWLLQRMAPESAAYAIAFAARLLGPVAPPTLAEALQVLVDRHESLRTSYPFQDGPRRQIVGHVPVELERVEASDWSEERLREAVDEAYRRPFDLDAPPLIRAHLFRRAPEEHVLLLNAHHLVVDGQSLFVLVGELFEVYRALVDGTPVPARAEGAVFGEFVEWQAKMVEADTAGRAFWDDVFDPPPEPLDLPTDRPRSGESRMRGGTVYFDVPPEVVAGLRELATARGATEYVVLLAAWSAYLARLTGTDDVVVGTPYHGRPSLRFAHTVGDFVNVVPMRTRMDGARPFGEQVERVRDVVARSMAHADYPLPRMGAGRRAGDGMGAPFDTLLAFHDFARHGDIERLMMAVVDEIRLGGVRLAPYRLTQQEGQFPLALDVWRREGGWGCTLKYDAELFDHASVQARAEEFRTLLRSAASDPDAPVEELAVVPDADLCRLDGWNDTARSWDWDGGVAERVAARAAARPDDLALEWTGGAWSYADLVDAARRVAGGLDALGVAPGDRVVLLMERRPEMLAALLGIQGAGAVYVPVDPTYPDARIRYVVEQSGATAVVTHRGLGDRFAGTARLLDLDAWPPAAPRPFTPVAPDDPAYVIYTSGSTGAPKGVEVAHGSLMNFLRAMAEEPGMAESDRLLAVTTISFDIAALELYLPLVVGACVVLATGDEALDGAALARRVEADAITVMQATPATWKLMVLAGWTGRDGLVALCGGEALPRALADDLLERVAALWNMYGPTETTIWSTLERVDPDGPILIGRPIANTTVHVLDGAMRPVPVGVPGELWIGGAGVAVGYAGRPDLTEERFRPSPFRPGERLYRTGDLVRYHRDGRLQHLGRLDHQVKVRGFRIELGEVEAVLRGHADVRDAVATATADHLVAHVVPAGPDVPDPDALSAWVAARLPAYMVPAFFVALEALPLTPNGKIDRKALPEPAGGASRASDHEEPRSGTEHAVATIWEGVLRLDRVGRNDDFFRLGGHSLTATQVVARIRDSLGVELPLRRFFDAPTVAEIAEWVASTLGETDVPPLRPTGADEAPLSFAQEAMWFQQMLSSDNVAYNVSGSVVLEGPLDVPRLTAALERVVARQDVLRTRIPAEHGRPRQSVLPEVGPVLHVEDMSALPREERLERATARVLDVLDAPYDLATGPLFRFHLVRLDDDRHLFGVGTHHTASDIWSFAVLGRELADAYNRPDAPAAPPPAVTYRDYAIWQREWMATRPLRSQMEHWVRKLDGVPTLDLPTDRPRPPFFTFEGASLRAALPGPLREAVTHLTSAQKATPFMAFLAAFEVFLFAHTRQPDLAVGVPIANRTQKATEDLVGTFVNTLVHRNDLSGDPTFREILDRVRATALDAYMHQDVPFEMLVRELDPARDPSRSPVFQVLFNVANVGLDGGELDGLRRIPNPLPRHTAQFDLSVTIGLNELQSDITLDYTTSLFDQATAQRFLDHYVEILGRVARDPDAPLSELAEVSTHDRALLLEAWNDTARDYDLRTALPALVQASAERGPDRPAVTSATGDWTRAELVDAARRVTAALVAMGVRPGDRVAILVERSREMLAALLGILGAGAAYVPVDPAYPAARVRYVLDDSAATALVTHRGLDRRFSVDTPVLDLDRWTPPDPVPFRDVDPDDTAYVIYTSGSTGRPKGVEIPHRAMVNFLRAMAEHPGMGERDVVLAVTTISFDIAVLELYLPLVVGARVVIADEREAADGRRLGKRIDGEGVTVMQGTPATWKLLLASGWSGAPELRVLCGGEPLPAALADDLLPRVGELWNLYGPTETTVWSTVQRILPGDEILIGRPVGNTTAYVLDPDMRPVPVGAPGELWIGGAGVATGYVGLPDLTEERFRPSPFRTGDRLYRTGDQVRYRADGRLEHLGRLDHQVKVRGYRIELGEVEAVLRAHDGLRDAVVAVRDERLVAWVVPRHPAPTVGELRTWVAGSLPPYMMPSFFVDVEALPLTPNGKVDRQALPEPGYGAVERPGSHAPSTPAERLLADVWADLLSVDEVGLDDNFFELGGHSLLAMEVVALVEERTGHRMDPRMLFFKPLGELADSLPPPD